MSRDLPPEDRSDEHEEAPGTPSILPTPPRVLVVAALIVVKWLLNYVSKHGYALFAWWRIIVGTLALLALAAGM